MNQAIHANGLCKAYPMHSNARQRLWRALRPASASNAPRHLAVDNVSFSVPRGQTLGILGRNGSGKSTLLKMVCGVVKPSSGEVRVAGKVAALLELGAGFNPEFSGRENVYLAGALQGLTRRELQSKFESIAAFAGIGRHLDEPVRTYSSGMFVRLAFSVAIHVDPDILVVDEALSVGDALFQAQCFAKFREFRQRGATVLLVTHSLGLITAHCDSALLMEAGRLHFEGAPKTAVDLYNRLLAGRPKEDAAGANRAKQGHKSLEWQGFFRLNPKEDRYGNRKAEITEAGIFTDQGVPAQVLERGGEYQVRFKIVHHQAMPMPIAAFSIKDPRGTLLCGTNTLFQDSPPRACGQGDALMVCFRFPIRLNAGCYLLNVGLAGYEQGNYVVYDRRFDLLAFEVVAGQERVGFFDPEAKIEITELI